MPPTIDLLPFLNRLEIVDKQARTVPLADVINWPQKHMVDHVSRNLSEGRQTRVIVLKARQLGISTIVEGLQFSLAMLFDNFRGQIVSHNSKSNEHLLSMTQTYFDTFYLHDAYTQRNKAANKLGWEPVNSRIGVTTAKTLEGGRGQTIHFLHGSEVAFWPNAAVLMAGLGQAIPKSPFSFIFLESTANGMGNWFATTWDDAVAGHNDYTPMFFPWQTHPEYTGRHIGIQPVDPATLDDHERNLYADFAQDRLGEENTLVLARSMIDADLAALRGPMPHEEILSRLAWRRYVIRNDLRGDVDLFLQEYPHRPSVAFLATGRNIFPLLMLEPQYQPRAPLVGDLASVGGRLRFTEHPTGPFKVFSPPKPGRHYVIGGDPTFTLGGDYACAQVLDRQTYEQVAVWRGRTDPGSFGELMVRLGYWYNTAILAPESNKDGATTIGRILGLDYPEVWQRQGADTLPGETMNRYGWFSNTRTKTEAIGNLKALLADGTVSIHDQDTFSELKNYVDLGMGRYGNANGEPNDDTVMALAIAATVASYEAGEMEHLTRDDSSIEQLRRQVNEMIRTTGGLEGELVLSGGDDW